jgi:hypothetical protein
MSLVGRHPRGLVELAFRRMCADLCAPGDGCCLAAVRSAAILLPALSIRTPAQVRAVTYVPPAPIAHTFQLLGSG